MLEKFDIAVIGGGIAGCSAAYHLADNGWDTVLIERDVLTSGTTWHAAGMVTQLGTTAQITKIRKNSVKFYNDLKDITGLDTSFRQTGTINIATSKSRHQEFMRQKTMSKLFNLDIEIIDNLYLLRTETQTFEFLTEGDQIKKIIFLDNLGYRHEITLTLKHG